QVYVLEHLSERDLVGIRQKALETAPLVDPVRVKIKEYEALLRLSGGDARKLLNVFELVAAAAPMGDKAFEITNEFVLKQVQQQMAIYDKAGEQHYDVVSAFIKSIRGSDPNAAVYWLARMIEGGEDPAFIARRLLILA